MTAETMSDYEIHEDQILGEGGMGTVCRGRQISLDRPVAIKIIRTDLTDTPTYVERFRREAELLGQVIDGHVVQVFGAGEWNGRLFYAMEFVEGEDLASRLQRGQEFPIEDLLRIAHGVARALKAAWKYKIVHRDIKPSNILITSDGRVKVADFGLARSLAQAPAHTMTIAGTAKYISPEQGLGDPVDIRSDIYSLGVVLFELATRQAPFEGDSPTSVIYSHVHAQPPSVKDLCPTVRDDVAALIMKCLSKKPEHRFQSPDELLDAISWIRSQVEPHVSPAPTIRTTTHRPRRRLAALAAMAILGPILIAALAYASWSRFSSDHHQADHYRKAINIAIGLGNHEEAMEIARKHFGPQSSEYARTNKAYRADQFSAWQLRAKEQAGRRNWDEAIKSCKVMAEFADGDRRDHAAAALAFINDLKTAEEAVGQRKWALALDIYERVRPPSDLRDYVYESKLHVRNELAREMELEANALIEKARGLRDRAQWAPALEAANKARDLRKQPFAESDALGELGRELEHAVRAPEGFVFVPAGPFPMGTDDGARAEGPSHAGETGAYYIGVRAVTRGDYAKFLEDEKSRTHALCPPEEPKNKDHTPDEWTQDLPKDEPVTGVDWFDAVAYARWAGLRLPTEKEWEKAAAFELDTRRSRPYPWGDSPSTETKDASFFGALGMGRGPTEWTQSPFEPYPGSDPVHAGYGKGHRVLRGGLIRPDDGAIFSRTTTRHWRLPTDRDKRVGFRCAKDVDQ